MNIDSIVNGIVIDHITAGRGKEIYNLLHLSSLDCMVALINNASSEKMGRKDIIKIDENIELDTDALGYVDPGVTVSIIANGETIEKKKLDLPEELKVPDYVKEAMDKENIPYVETTDLESAMPTLDILYMTRVQRERFFNEEDYLRLKDSYILTVDKLENAKQNLSILHPLPRVNEISVAVDDDPRACYFKQVLCGKYMRMALILKLLGV